VCCEDCGGWRPSPLRSAPSGGAVPFGADWALRCSYNILAPACARCPIATAARHPTAQASG